MFGFQITVLHILAIGKIAVCELTSKFFVVILLHFYAHGGDGRIIKLTGSNNSECAPMILELIVNYCI